MRSSHFKKTKAEHFIKLAEMSKLSGIGSSLIDSLGLALMGAAFGGVAGGAMEEDPYMIHDSMARGALVGGGIGGVAPLLIKALGGSSEAGLDKLRKFRDTSADDLLSRASGMA